MEKPLVLLADDNDATCTLVAAVLGRDFIVEIATDGREAIDKLRNRQYQAVLLDLRMPVVDGFGVLQFLTEERPELLSRVLVLTAAVARGEMERVRAYPIASVIAKPFEVDALLNAVKACAGDGDRPARGSLLSGSMLLLLAEFMRGRWM